jgi:FAD/FMN-containing dehydrogenase
MSVIQDLIAALGPGAVMTGNNVGARHRSDASLTGDTLPKAVLRPDSVDSLAEALRLCHRHGQSVVPQGGMTGLAGGANPRPDDIALSLERLTGIEEIDVQSGTMTVLAGTPLETAQQAARDAGFLLPIDLGARGSCQIGGVLSTNAGGIRVIRYGQTRDNVLGLEAVLADGTVLTSLNKAIKNNTGYDLRQLFIGSEGTLGVITRAVLRLRPLPVGRQTALCALQSYEDATRLLKSAQLELPGLSAFEIMWEDYFRFNEQAVGLRHFSETYPFIVIIETEGEEPDDDGLQDFLSARLDDGLILDALIAQSEKDRLGFWAVREGLEMDRLLPNLVNLDVSMAIGRLGTFAEDCGAALLARFPQAHVSFFGHVGDGNLHIAVSVPEANEADIGEISRIAYGFVRTYYGSISAEHGIGTLKRPYLSYSRSEAELELMRSIKAALDPKGILNPGKVI